ALHVLDISTRSEITTVYNLTVADYHTYAVGNGETLVHNKAQIRFMRRKSNLSGKEAATDVPSFARGKPPMVGETPTQYAERLMIERYGENWQTIFKKQGKKIDGPKSEFSEIKKAWRGFE
ncbi:MAG: HINT domain-containing protein, partial [Planctomycetaceae bacterium]|nr:HINT domain-containing protein [Planctomycetaceae bacterium]